MVFAMNNHPPEGLFDGESNIAGVRELPKHFDEKPASGAAVSYCPANPAFDTGQLNVDLAVVRKR